VKEKVATKVIFNISTI